VAPGEPALLHELTSAITMRIFEFPEVDGQRMNASACALLWHLPQVRARAASSPASARESQASSATASHVAAQLQRIMRHTGASRTVRSEPRRHRPATAAARGTLEHRHELQAVASPGILPSGTPAQAAPSARSKPRAWRRRREHVCDPADKAFSNSYWVTCPMRTVPPPMPLWPARDPQGRRPVWCAVLYDLLVPELCASGRLLWVRDAAAARTPPGAWRGTTEAPWQFTLASTPMRRTKLAPSGPTVRGGRRRAAEVTPYCC